MPKIAPALVVAVAAFMPAAMATPASASVPMAVFQAASPALVPIPVAKRRAYRNGRKIACTPFGCHPIPRGCIPVTEYDWWGNPTGYDRVVCPRRR